MAVRKDDVTRLPGGPLPRGAPRAWRALWLVARLALAMVVARLVLAAGPVLVVATVWLAAAVLIDANVAGLRERLRLFDAPRRRTACVAWGAFAAVGLAVLWLAVGLHDGGELSAAATAPASPAAAAIVPSAAPTAVARWIGLAPTPTAAPDAEEARETAGGVTREEELADAAAWLWGRDWPGAVGAIEELVRLEPGRSDWREKLYAAYLSAGDALLERGLAGEAAWRYGQARDLDPARGVAQRKLNDLKPPLPDDVRAYAEFLGPRLATLAEAVAAVTAPGASAGGEAWRRDAATAARRIQTVGDEVQHYYPVPDAAESLDDRAVAAGKELVAAAGAFGRAVEAADTTAIETDSRRLADAGAAARALAADLDALRDRFRR